MDLEERMLLVEKESTVNGQMAKTHRQELNELFALFRGHMEKEEEQRQELIGLISHINAELGKQKSFWAGIIFTSSAVWVIGIAVWHYFTR